MDSATLQGLQRLNQLRLTAEQEAEALGFFAAREAELAQLDAINTQNTERMVHVMPLVNVLRKDVVIKSFERDDLQEGAPQVMDGYWQVPQLLS